MVTLGTGGGVLIGGKILRGCDGTAGEIGHICVEPFGAPCGCVEQYASATAIVRLAKDLATQYPSSNLKENPHPTAYDVYLAGTEGDALALEVFRQTGFDTLIFIAYCEQILRPTLRDRDVIVLDNLGAHRASRIEEITADCSARVIWLPPYSPDFSPIELMWSKVKAYLKKVKARTQTELEKAMAAALEPITLSDCLDWFRHCGYQVTFN